MSDPSLPSPTPPADWYPDPSGQWDYRFWNGHSWTAHVSRAGVAYVDPHTAHLRTGEQATAEQVTADPATVEQPTSDHLTVETAQEAAHRGGLGSLFTEHREERAEREEVERLVHRASAGDPDAADALPEAVAKVSPGWLDRHRWSLLAEVVRGAVQDDLLETFEAERVQRVADALQAPVAELAQHEPEAYDELVVGQVNAGRLPVVADAPILTRRGEQVHGVFRVELMHEVAVREFHGGSSGVSIPLGAGLRYRVGAVRGHTETVGSEMVAQDAGLLAVTSTRTVFSGQRRTVELRHDRLVGLEQYSDGLRFNVTGRQTASLFRFTRGSSPSVAAALVNAAREQSG